MGYASPDSVVRTVVPVELHQGELWQLREAWDYLLFWTQRNFFFLLHKSGYALFIRHHRD